MKTKKREKLNLSKKTNDIWFQKNSRKKFDADSKTRLKVKSFNDFSKKHEFLSDCQDDYVQNVSEQDKICHLIITGECAD